MPERITADEIQAIFDRVGPPEEDRSVCPTCRGAGRVLNLNVLTPCPQCRADSVDKYGQRDRYGNILTWETFSRIVPDKSFLGHKNRTSCILSAPTKTGKTLFLRTLYNDMLDKYRFRSHILFISESEIIRAIRVEGYSELMDKAKSVKAVLIDDFATPENWQMWPEVKQMYFDFVDELYERRPDSLQFFAVGCCDHRDVIKDERWLWRLRELAKGQIIKPRGQEKEK